MNRNVLVTGSNGFVGQHLVKELAKNYYVYATDNQKSAEVKSDRLILGRIPKDIIHYFPADITKKEEIKYALKKSSPEQVYHLAGVSAYNQRGDSHLMEGINLDGTRNLLESIVELGMSPRILLVGTAQSYGFPLELPIKETHPLNPRDEYGRTKAEVEKLNFDLDIIHTRSFNHTGPGQAPKFICSDFAKQVAEIDAGLREPAISVGNLSSQRDFTDVRDVCRAYQLLLEKGRTGEAYNVCSGVTYSGQDILDTFLSFSPKKIRVDVDKSRMRPSEISILVGDNSKLKKETGWTLQIPFKQTLKGLYDYWREKIR